MQEFVRRNRAAVTAGALVSPALILSLAGPFACASPPNLIPCRFFGSGQWPYAYDGGMSIHEPKPARIGFDLPDPEEMYRAFLDRNAAYDGVFFVAVSTTGIFCRPTCTARKPRKRNVQFFSRAADALAAGYRACRRCRPLEVSGQVPPWLDELLRCVEADPAKRWTDQEIRDRGLEPSRVSRWFKSNHGITFHSYLRCRRLSAALAQLAVGQDATQVALDAGYSSLSGFRDAFQKWFGAPPGQVGQRRVLLVNRVFTPLGPMVVAADDQHLFVLEFADRRMLQSQVARLAARLNCGFCPGENAIIAQTGRQLSQYFKGNRREFTMPFQMPGTDFQRAVWSQLLAIPFGQTSDYHSLAESVGSPGGSRAVGRANGDNRLALVIPCHRVVRSDGRLSGYGGGIRRKAWLLNHERAVNLSRPAP